MSVFAPDHAPTVRVYSVHGDWRAYVFSYSCVHATIDVMAHQGFALGGLMFTFPAPPPWHLRAMGWRGFFVYDIHVTEDTDPQIVQALEDVLRRCAVGINMRTYYMAPEIPAGEA